MKCDYCQEEYLKHKLIKFTKKQLIKKDKEFIHEKLNILKNTNQNFNRKTRLCENCIKDLDFKESIYVQEQEGEIKWKFWK